MDYGDSDMVYIDSGLEINTYMAYIGPRLELNNVWFIRKVWSKLTTTRPKNINDKQHLITNRIIY